jgi:hypothetical protein
MRWLERPLLVASLRAALSLRRHLPQRERSARITFAT